MAKTLKDLLLALLNATLILLALCLFLGWKLAASVESVTERFSDTVETLAPLRTEAQSIRGELAALRSDLATISLEKQVVDPETAQNIRATLSRLNAVEQKLQAVQARFADLANSPDVLIDQAIQAGADGIARQAKAIKGCVPEA